MTDKHYNRRDFVRKGVKGLTGFVDNLREELTHDTADAGDIRIMSAMADYPGKDGHIAAFIARPDGPGVYPAIIVIHEIFGLVDHIKDVAIRLAREGFVAIAPDLFSREAPLQHQNDATMMLDLVRSIPDSRFLNDLVAAIAHLNVLTFVDEKRIGALGFCMGGLYAYLMAARTPRLSAIADFYGRVAYPGYTAIKPEAPIDVVSRLHCPILGIFAGEDHVVPVDDVHRLKDTMMEHKKSFEIKVYRNAPHAFFNDTRTSYRPDEAHDAWRRTINFFRKHLEGPNT
ncbi:MAG: dienelactone hydrolase family protein [Candidatus Latescibacteria bacterium]|nr:dienelactone hydrolase family protein [Candidatus Latescibacterota bacterium]